MTCNPYIKSDTASFLPSFVGYADILGFSHFSKEAFETGNGLQFLAQLRAALTKAYERVRRHAQGLGKEDFFLLKVFTDNIVIGYPLQNQQHDLGEPEFVDMLCVLAEFQLGLAEEGFLIRGGISFGDFYMDNDIVFGKPLIEAVKHDKVGGAPRLVVTPSAMEMVTSQLKQKNNTEITAHYDLLLKDPDESLFLNYLDEVFCGFPVTLPVDALQKHKETIETNLEKNKGIPGVRVKYEWAAQYHNFVCNEFVGKHSSDNRKAEEVLDYLIDMNQFDTQPDRIKFDSKQ